MTAEQAAAARHRGLDLVEPLRVVEDGCIAARPGTGFFCRHLLRYLDDLGLGAEELRSGGYTIRSTLDLRVTDAARRAAANEVDLQEALALSPNTTFLALLDRLGSVDPVVDTARRLGLRESLREPGTGGRTVADAVRAEERASFTLGPVPTTPLELANVAATIVSGGIWCPPSPTPSSPSFTSTHVTPDHIVVVALANVLVVPG